MNIYNAGNKMDFTREKFKLDSARNNLKIFRLQFCHHRVGKESQLP